MPKLLTLLALVAACTPVMTGLPDDPDANPLVPEHPMYPFPSDFYLRADASTPTGRALRLPTSVLPEGLAPSMFDDADGFSRAPAILAWTSGGFDPASLPDPNDPGATLLDDSPVWLLEAGTWARVPVLVEIDSQTTNPARQALILRPHVALKANTGHVVVLRDGLSRRDGSAPRASDAFVALRDQIRTDSDTVEGMREDFALVREALDATGVSPDEVWLAWSFHTRSREGIETPMRAMHQAMADASLAPWAITSDAVVGARREVRGTFTTPEFLLDGALVLDGDGAPIAQGTTEIPFLLSIPDTVTSTRPVIAFGHGFFSEKEEITWGSFDGALREWAMSAVAIDFAGFDDASAVDTASAVAGDLGALRTVVAQQRQNQARFTALARLVEEALAPTLTATGPDGAYSPLMDHDTRYLGISNGGTQGFGILAGSPVLRRGVLVVPGAGWSHMLQRAVQWNTLGFVIESRYDSALEIQLVLSLMQLVFDPVDVLSFPERLLDEPFEPFAPLEVTLHEAIGDTQVASLVTHWAARSTGIPLVVPAPSDVWGLEPLEAAPPGASDARSGLFRYDEGYDPLPSGNTPPATENGAHASVRQLPAYRAQVGAFLEDGTIVQVCDGACDPD